MQNEGETWADRDDHVVAMMTGCQGISVLYQLFAAARPK